MLVNLPVHSSFVDCNSRRIDMFEQEIIKISKEHRVPLIHPRHTTEIEDMGLGKNIFLNSTHLCPVGASVFTQDLVRRLKLRMLI